MACDTELAWLGLPARTDNGVRAYAVIMNLCLWVGRKSKIERPRGKTDDLRKYPYSASWLEVNLLNAELSEPLAQISCALKQTSNVLSRTGRAEACNRGF